MDNIIYLTSGAVILLLIWIIHLELRLKRLLRGKNGSDLEELLVKTSEDLVALQTAREDIRNDISAIREKMRHHIRGVRTIRFNPFKDSGSNQSFATALINDQGDGVVISSIYSRDRVGVYAKPIKNHTSEYELSEEERLAINESQNHKV